MTCGAENTKPLPCDFCGKESEGPWHWSDTSKGFVCPDCAEEQAPLEQMWNEFWGPEWESDP